MYLTRPYTPGDEPQICDLFQQVFASPLTTAQWRWKYLGLTGIPPISRVAIDRAGHLIGHAGAMALRGQAYGESMPIYQIADVMVHPQARGYLGERNLFIHLVRELLADIGVRYPKSVAYGFPGTRPFLLGEWARVYERIEQAQELVWTPGTLLSNPWWLRATDMAWSQIPLERLWQRLHPHLPLSLVRDKEYLLWRYVRNPYRSYKILGLHWLGRCNGWAVITLKGTECLITDILVSKEQLLPALGAIDAWARARRIKTLRLWLPATWRERLSLPCIDTPIVTANMCWGLPWKATELRGALYYTMGDLDIF